MAETAGQIADPDLAWLFSNCFPNTLDTTVTHSGGDGAADSANREDTFIITGDIDAMWLRDSTNQVWPYLPYAKECAKLRALFRGLIRRQARCVLLDPYANAFYKTPDRISEFKSDHTEMKPGVHERKYELDSLASVLRLATGYFETTGDATAFDTDFYAALDRIFQTITDEQAGTPEQIHPYYSFARSTANALDTLPNGAHGNPCKRTGMSRSPFRPSDDASIFQYHIPANAMASVMLKKTMVMLDQLRLARPDVQRHERLENLEGKVKALKFQALSLQIKLGIEENGVIGDPKYGWVYAYETDGFGSRLMMDDGNLPSLLSLPYLGFCPPNQEVYQNTRRFILSPDNPHYHAGAAASGIGSPHVGLGWIWPLSLITQALTSIDDAEILTCLRTLVRAHAYDGEGAGFMHESFWMDEPKRYTRGWFAWANTFFGELILHIAATRPHLLRQSFA